MEYNPSLIEAKWQSYWRDKQTFKSENFSEKAKYYVLDMFPYPSGAGLHVGHPLGYIASDIIARYKRHCGFNVLHPMGYDSFGLPAEQYAIQTGQHPALTTQQNIERYRKQLDRIGFSFDWSREIRTSEPGYYKWTQWIFLRLFNAYYNHQSGKAEPIDQLIKHFENQGFLSPDHDFLTGDIEHDVEAFTAQEWRGFTDQKKEEVLQQFRLAYLSEAYVNWCPAMGTVLANEEVKDGVSERGGFPVERRLMQQWSLRITAYAERLFNDLDELDWPESLKEAQRYWIGKSQGAEVYFQVKNSPVQIPVFTTRPDTLFGVSFIVLAPEHEWVPQITQPEFREAVDQYVHYASNRSERDRMADVKKITGQFTGAYAIHPLTGAEIPIWIGDYVLVGYGTGAVMAVPAGDQRDYDFAKHFGLPIPEIFAGADISEHAEPSTTLPLINADFLNGLCGNEAKAACIAVLEEKKCGKGKVNYRLRDAVFGRQRYWGEPIPVYYEDGIAKPFREEHLPLVLPEIDAFLPTEAGDPPLARATTWNYHPERGLVPNGEGYPIETTTMPGWAGSSWYFLRYMDPHNSELPFDKEVANYWNQIDLYMGGAEHATGHLLYFRFWTKFLADMGYIQFEEPAKKLINQGMIQGRSNFVYRIENSHTFVSKGLKNAYKTTAVHVDVNIVNNDVLDREAFKAWRDDFKDAEFILENDQYICGWEVEKMSKSKWNVINPDFICDDLGADTLRMYEMFLGPIEQHKPWNTNGISGVSNFIKKTWRLFYPQGQWAVVDEPAQTQELKVIHKTIKKITDDMERHSFNTMVSALMIAVNELSDLKCHKKEVLEPLLILLSPLAPHFTEELWQQLGHAHSISTAPWPHAQEAYLVEASIHYPIQFNGKMRFTLELPAHFNKEQVEVEVLGNEATAKYLEGKAVKKIIVVPHKIVNLVF
ncbi:MAG TPA: leucine--tRNA ligase [Luteibaculaceae bacterium]|nr:leucine--tRNA ligase [Luteibaculaceae bacterium]